MARTLEEEPQPAEIHWEGDAREVLAGFPEAVRAEFGYSLWPLQQGRTPKSATRRMQSLGPGVWELKESDEKTWYRVVYLSKIANVIYVLHCFEKRSHKTDRRDLEIVNERLRRVQQRIRLERME
ncbi:MAG TPA: type II toxin-antitoxin system RelE/ParE family toxin [Terriglobales bacterium]|nr:type II toxin-antitoxin system RelE/ParE family toxin [Terriglobales bacterium]